jgi:hypothetical protein
MEEKRLTTEEWREHIESDEIFQGEIKHILYGNKDMQEMGLIEMNKEMYKILTQAKNVKGFFGGIGSFGKWVFLVVGMIAIFKVWGAALVAWFISNKP